MKGQPLSVHGNSLGEADFLILFHMKTDNRTQATCMITLAYLLKLLVYLA